MIRVMIEQGLLQLFDQVLKPLDRDRIRALVQESVEKEDPAILRELLREISFVGPLQRSVESWAEGFRNSDYTRSYTDVDPDADPDLGPDLGSEASASATPKPGDDSPPEPPAGGQVDP